MAGGESPAARRPVPGLGTTQLAPGESGAAAGAAASSSATPTVPAIGAFDPASRRLLAAGHLQVPVSHAAAVVAGAAAWIIGGESGGKLVSAVQMLRPSRAFGTAGAPRAGPPYFGARLLVADRGNNRLLLLDARMHVLMAVPASVFPARTGRGCTSPTTRSSPAAAPPSSPTRSRTRPSSRSPTRPGRIIWSYGHPGRAGAAAGYLSEPDDAYLLKNGQVTVADANNCRVLVINAEPHGRAPDRRHRHLRASPAGLHGLAERGHARCRTATCWCRRSPGPG